MATKKARVLADIVVFGIPFKPNSVIEAEASVIKGLGDDVDDSAAAVKYAIESEGAEPVLVVEPVADDAAPAAEAPAA